MSENTETPQTEEKLSLAEELKQNYLAAQDKAQEPANDDAAPDDADDAKELPTEPSPKGEPKPESDKPAEQPAKDAKQQKTDFQAPAHLDKQGREALAKIQDPVVKQQLTTSLERMAKNAQRVQQQAQESTKQWAAISSVFEPHRATLQAQGLNETTATQRLLQIHDFAQKSPAEYIKWFASQAGIDLGTIIPQQAQKSQPESEEYLTPAEKRALDKADELEKKLNALNQNYSADYQSRQTQAVQQTIESFRTAANDDGSLKYPKFDDLQNKMAELINKGMTLEDSYKAAYALKYGLTAPENEKQQQKREVAQKAVVSGKRVRSNVPPVESRGKVSMAEEMRLRYQGQL